VLPRPLYALRSGQIFRIETDGSTQTQITYEVPFDSDVLAVTEFAVSPADSTLVYTVQRQGPPLLVRADGDGQNAAPLYDNPEAGVANPLFTPDGQFVAVRLFDNADDGVTFPAGLYLLPIAGGEPQLLVADDPIVNPETPAFGHQPLAFSPDGTRLLTSRYSLQLELCDLGVVSVPDGTAIGVQVPPPADDERQSTCGFGAWSPDGADIYFVVSRIGAPPASPAIWRADPTTGESFPITPTPGVAPFTFYAAPSVAADGTLLAFTTVADQLPEAFSDTPAGLSYSMARIDRASGELTELRPAVNESPEQMLWDPEGRGAVGLLLPEIGDPGLFWLPADGGEATLLLGATTDLYSYAWGAE
jgi:Tol biopolymer transport system component